MIELGLIILSSLVLCVSWIHRGGSLHWGIPSTRFTRLLVTPLFISLAVGAALWPDLRWWEEYAYLILGLLLFAGAQAPGFGRQFDLGQDTGRDDEWGWQIRDMIFGKEPPILDKNGVQKIDWKGRPMHKGSYARDLTGLYMRFTWFILPAIAWFFVNPLVAIIPIVVWIGSPLVWVAEHKIFKDYVYGSPERETAIKKKTPIGSSWVEFYISIMIAIITLLVSLFAWL